MAFDVTSTSKVVVALPPQTVTADVNGSVVDTAGFNSVTFAVASGTITDGSYTFQVEHGDQSDLSDAVAVPDSQLIGTEAGMALADTDDNTVVKIGYKRVKRYCRIVIQVSGATSGGVFGGVAILGGKEPTAAETAQKA